MKKILLVIIGAVILVGLIMYLTRETDRAQSVPAATVPTDTAKTAEVPTITTTTTTATSTGTAADTSTGATTTTSTTIKTPGVLEVTVHGANYKFDPVMITAKEGQVVRLTFISDGGLHDFTLDEFAGAKTKQLQGGKGDAKIYNMQTIEFTATKKGTFTYYCSVGNHRAMGMEGTLVVE